MYQELILRRAKRQPVLINITSLIDVMFLLLIFFMVSSTFLEQPALEIELPISRTAGTAEITHHIVVLDATGGMFFNDEPVTELALRQKLEALAAKDAETSLLLKADRAVSYGKVIEMMDVVRESGLKHVKALTAHQESQPTARELL